MHSTGLNMLSCPERAINVMACRAHLGLQVLGGTCESHESIQGPGIVDVIAAVAGGGKVVESVTGCWSRCTGHVSTLHMLLLVLFTAPHYAIQG